MLLHDQSSCGGGGSMGMNVRKAMLSNETLIQFWKKWGYEQAAWMRVHQLSLELNENA